MSQANSEEESEPTVQIILAGENPNEFNTYDYKTALAKALEEHELKRNQITNPMNKSTEKIQLKCDYCDYTASRRQTLNLHVRKHTGESPFVCDVCGHKSTHVRCHKLHEATHSGKNIFQCNFCSYKTIYSHSFKMHVKRHTINFQNTESFDCKLCVFRAVDRHELRFHMLKLHTDPKKVFDCPLCNYASTRPSDVRRHLNTHGVISDISDYCDSCIRPSSTDTESILPD